MDASLHHDIGRDIVGRHLCGEGLAPTHQRLSQRVGECKARMGASTPDEVRVMMRPHFRCRMPVSMA